MGTIDPRKTLVDVDGRPVPVVELAHAWDEVRLNKVALNPVPMLDLTVSRSTKVGESFQVVGYAAVFGRRSLDLGGFTEKIDRAAFDSVLDRDPDVHAVWDHDTRAVLARTRNHTLELSTDPRGLRNWMKVAPTSYAADLRILMERGDVDQQSFAFTVENDTWDQDEDGAITRTVTEVADLYDVTITAQGAYPQTVSQVVRSFLATDRRVFAVPDLPEITTAASVEVVADPPTGDEVEDRSAAPDEDATVEDAAQGDPADDLGTETHEEVVADPERELALRELKAKAELRKTEFARLKERMKEL